MNNSEDSGSKCSPAPISSFTIQSILGTSNEGVRSAGKDSPKSQQRKRTLSVSSEDDCSAGEDSGDCYCSESGVPEPCNPHQPLNFCLGKSRYHQCHFIAIDTRYHHGQYKYICDFMMFSKKVTFVKRLTSESLSIKHYFCCHHGDSLLMLSPLPTLNKTAVVFLSDILSRLGEQGKGQIINRI